MNLKSKEFKALEKKWYKKLKDDGFEDIEKGSGRQDYLLKPGVNTERLGSHRFGGGGFEFKEEYYRRAGQFLHDYKFANELERRIWTMHADGQSIRDIVTVLNKRRAIVSKRKVHDLLQRLKEEMLKDVRSK